LAGHEEADVVLWEEEGGSAAEDVGLVVADPEEFREREAGEWCVSDGADAGGAPPALIDERFARLFTDAAFAIDADAEAEVNARRGIAPAPAAAAAPREKKRSRVAAPRADSDEERA
jgi:hypothetical protein